MVGQFSASGGGRTGRRHATTSRSSASGRAPRPQHVTRDRELAAEAHRTLHTLRTASVRPALNSLWTGTTSDEHGLIDATTKRVEDARAAHARDIRAIFATESLMVAALGWLMGLPLGYLFARLMAWGTQEVLGRRSRCCFAGIRGRDAHPAVGSGARPLSARPRGAPAA